MSVGQNASAAMPLVSVVVPIYNKAPFLTDALRSFERQTYGSVEWVLVDDGSTDASGDICRSWKPGHGSARFLQKENGGASSARNEGLRHARGEYVLFWDADDAQDPNAIEKMVAAALAAHADVAVSAIRRIEQDGREVDLFTCEEHKSCAEEALSEWLRGKVSTGPVTKLVRRSVLEDNAIGFEEGVINEDVMWTAEVLCSAETVVFLGEPLYHYISRPGSVTMAATDMRLLDVFDNCAKLERYIGETHPDISDACRDYCASVCWNVICASSEGEARRRYPELYSKSMAEYAKRRNDIHRCRNGLKDRVLQVLVDLGLYGLIKR